MSTQKQKAEQRRHLLGDALLKEPQILFSVLKKKQRWGDYKKTITSKIFPITQDLAAMYNDMYSCSDDDEKKMEHTSALKDGLASFCGPQVLKKKKKKWKKKELEVPSEVPSKVPSFIPSSAPSTEPSTSFCDQLTCELIQTQINDLLNEIAMLKSRVIMKHDSSESLRNYGE